MTTAKTNKPAPEPRRISFTACTVGLFVVLALVAVATVAVGNARQALNSGALADANGIPTAWAAQSHEIMAVSELTAKVVDNQLVQYTTSVRNTDAGRVLYLTHIASYLSDGEVAGYVKLKDSSLRYTYTPEDDESWRTVAVSAPSNTGDGFRLGRKLAVGKAGTESDTIYVQYSVLPATASGIISDRVAFLMTDQKGAEVGYTYSSATVAYHDLDEEVIASQVVKPAGDEPFAQPLGEADYVPAGDVATEFTGGEVQARMLAVVSLSKGVVVALLVVLGAAVVLAACGKKRVTK